LQQIPSIVVEIFEHSYGAVRFVARGFTKLDAKSVHLVVVSPEIIGVKEKRVFLKSCGSFLGVFRSPEACR